MEFNREQEIKERLGKATAGPWKPDLSGANVLACDDQMMICNIRGWGYLTGTGGLNLSDRDAMAIQDANTVLISSAPDDIAYLLLEVEQLRAREAELERRLRIPFSKLPCSGCGGPHDFDTSVPSVLWNEVIRARGLSEYLCTTCIVREFVRAGQSFTAQLWNEEFNGVSIEVMVTNEKTTPVDTGT